ncbi:MAG: ribosome small subunit-dependent GTPase A [Micropepsaceae bacterium]
MLEHYGWSETLRQQFEPYAAEGLKPGRVIIHQRGPYRIVTDEGELSAEMSGRFVREAEMGGFPAAGDWVAASLRPHEGAATIHAVLPRRTAFIRKAAGRGRVAQVVAANVDIAFLALSLNDDLNIRRLERYLASVHESGAEPQIVLTKADLTADAEARGADVAAAAKDVKVHLVSVRAGTGLESVRAEFRPGLTAVLLGSSGVGKSTLVNALAGAERMATRAIREDDDKGRHTTTHRELVLLPGGGLLLDTPGMRELALWEADEGVSQTFEDIEALEAACRFSDCGHGNEPGCAVRAALESGDLDPARLESHRKLKGELAHEQRKEDPAARAAHKKMWVTRAKALKARYKARNEDD